MHSIHLKGETVFHNKYGNFVHNLHLFKVKCSYFISRENFKNMKKKFL